MNGIQWEPNKAVKLLNDEIARLRCRISEQDQQIDFLKFAVERLQTGNDTLRAKTAQEYPAFYCPHTCPSASEDGCERDAELPDANFEDMKGLPICPLYASSVQRLVGRLLQRAKTAEAERDIAVDNLDKIGGVMAYYGTGSMAWDLAACAISGVLRGVK